MLVVVGDLVEDVVVWPLGPVRRGTDTAARIERRRGGSAANVARFAAAVGAPVRFVGSVGSDAIGAALADELAATGVDVRVQRHGRTGTILVLVEPDGERTMLPDRGACTELTEVDDAWLDGVRWLHVPAYSLIGEPLAASVRSLVARARRRGARLSVDASSVGALTESIGLAAFSAWLDEVRPDLLLANEEEAAALGLPGPPPHAAAPGAARAAALTVVKQGPDPVLVWAGEAVEPDVVAVPHVDEVRDTTGAGDAFAAGFLAATMRGEPPHTAALAGIALARRVLGNPGASL